MGGVNTPQFTHCTVEVEGEGEGELVTSGQI